MGIFNWKKFPYTNFHELNLDYFINKFNEIFAEWDNLYNTLKTWKDTTTTELETWKTATTAELEAWETDTLSDLNAWKYSTEVDISAWETATLSALNAWKTATEAVFEQIRIEAAASATAAAASATDAATAKTAAQTAQAAAEAAAASVTASAAQIITNKNDISDLKTQLADVEGFAGINYYDIIAQDGKKFITPGGDISTATGNYHISTPIPVSAGDEIHFTCLVAGPSIAVISLCDSDSANISPVVVGVNGGISNEYVYNVKSNGYIILSYRYDEAYELYILNEKSNNVLKARIDKLAGELGDKIDNYRSADFNISNSRIDENGAPQTSNGATRTEYIPCAAGVTIEWYGASFWYQGSAVMLCVAFYNTSKQFISGVTQVDGSSATTSQTGTIKTTAPSNTAYIIASCNSGINSPYIHIYDIDITKTMIEAESAAKNLPITDMLIISPALSNGSGGNAGNANAVTARAVKLYDNVQSVSVKINRELSSDGNYYKIDISAFKGENWYTNRITNIVLDGTNEYTFDSVDVINGVSDVDAFGVTIWEYSSSDVLQTLRIGDFENGDMVIRYVYPDSIQTKREIDNEEINHKILNARHNAGNVGTKLTILHFSDLHKDQDAVGRIVTDVKKFTNNINEIICTGDMVGSTAEEISSWWIPNILTCIGNHDCASYSDDVYNWTALSMADRDAYYIAPFESGWDIVHTPGTSYYYKDYETAKIRLIVMDVMLYNDGGAEATAQTTWLENLLSDATTNNLHVLIAIHAPHGGSTAEECSFSKYAETTMPVLTDCNTPQDIIDLVATKITAGLKFIGYIVGHTHQDNIWDAKNDGTQLMYCVTCASTTAVQWKNSDQYRDSENDAYNIITIDTTNGLIKIIRGGGADIDDRMRTRKAICFDYLNGTKVGEVL